MLRIDHLFCCTNQPRAAVAQMIDAGFRESPGRAHPGQGTENSKFHFGGFFVEVLWVREPRELDGPEVAGSGLPLRLRPASELVSPFGLCVVNEAGSDALFADAHHYQPSYFALGNTIHVVETRAATHLPWTFRLPYRDAAAPDLGGEPHPNGARAITGARFITSGELRHPIVQAFQDHPVVSFATGARPALVLECDAHAQGRTVDVPELSLTLRF